MFHMVDIGDRFIPNNWSQALFRHAQQSFVFFGDFHTTSKIMLRHLDYGKLSHSRNDKPQHMPNLHIHHGTPIFPHETELDPYFG